MCIALMFKWPMADKNKLQDKPNNRFHRNVHACLRGHIKMDLRELRLERVDWIRVAQDRD